MWVCSPINTYIYIYVYVYIYYLKHSIWPGVEAKWQGARIRRESVSIYIVFVCVTCFSSYMYI